MAEQKPGKVCHDCGRTYWRGNRFRLWVTRRLPGGRILFTKLDVKVCLQCFANRQRSMVHIIRRHP